MPLHEGQLSLARDPDAQKPRSGEQTKFKRKAGPIPAEALAWFKAKGLKPGFSYLDVWRAEHKASFTVAKIMELDILKDIQDSISSAIEEGQTFKAWANDIEGTFDRSGWSQYGTEAEKPRRLRTVFDMNMRMSRAAGQWERAERTKDVMPYWEWNLGPSRIHREEHLQWEGLILRIDDPWFDTHAPPCGYG